MSFRYIWMILKIDLMSLFKKGRRGGKKPRIQQWLILGLYTILAAALYYGSYKLFVYLDSLFAPLPVLSDALALNIFNSLAIYAVSVVFLTGIQIIFRALYESDDISFLISQPIPTKAVFSAKLITAYTTLLPLVLVTGIPVLFAWGYVNRAGFLFYLMSVLSFLVLPLLTSAAVTLILLFIMRYLPGAKLKRLFVVTGSLFGLLIVFGSQMLSAKISSNTDFADVFTQFGSMNLSKASYLPTTWAVNSILGTVSRFNISWVTYALPLFLLTGALAYFAAFLSDKWYFFGWASSGEGESAGRSSKKRARRQVKPGPRGTFWTVLRKDLKLLFRDPVLWYGFLTGVIVLGFFLYNTSRTVTTGSFQSMMSHLFLWMVCLMGAVVSSQTGGISLSREGSSFWLLQANPAKSTSLFMAKFVYAVFPSVALVVPFSIVFHFTGAAYYALWRQLLLGLSVAAIAASAQLLFDAYFPDFTIEVVIGLSKSGKGQGKLIIATLVSMVVVMIPVFALILPNIIADKAGYSGMDISKINAIMHAAIVLLAVSVVLAARRFGSRQIERLLIPD